MCGGKVMVHAILDQKTDAVTRLLRQQAALATFGSYAFHETDLLAILTEAARICAESLEVPHCKVCRYRAKENDLLIVAGCGWHTGVIGRVVSQADETSPQGRAYSTGEPIIIRNLQEQNNLNLPDFYAQHGIVSTADVVIKGYEDTPYGVLEIDSPTQRAYDEHDINFLTGFANVLAEAVATQSRMHALRMLVEEKNLLAQELQHRVRNNLQLIQGMLDIYGKSVADGPPKVGIESIARRVMTLGQVYDHLLGTGMKRHIDFGEYVKTLCASLPEVVQNPGITLTCATQSTTLGLDKVSTLGMVVAELVTNCYEHGFPDGRKGEIVVALCGVDANGNATLTISDNGVGFLVGAASNRNGLTLVRRLARQVNGSADVQCEGGTTWTITFPAQAPVV